MGMDRATAPARGHRRLARPGRRVVVDAATGELVRRLASDAVYASAVPGAGRPLRVRAALDDDRTAGAGPAGPDRGRPGGACGCRTRPRPAGRGRLEEVSVETDGVTVRGWLCLPRRRRPAPLMQWIHGGPFVSYNTWSWRWSPWLAVARGWAVLLPDPPLSTGYGYGWLERAWPYQARVVWSDVEALLDSVIARPDIDGTRTALLGASFGGFMTNWIAGHTDRFGAIVTHAGLWALDQQHATTDAAHYKTGIFGTLAEHPDWYAENSPHDSVDAIRIPMLVVHGNRDYRVPVSEALRLWWDLVSRWDGDPADLPHRFLQLTGENHWVLSPANAQIWWDACWASAPSTCSARRGRRATLLYRCEQRSPVAGVGDPRAVRGVERDACPCRPGWRCSGSPRTSRSARR